jgi:lysophospholipase L1-like esterase
MRKASLLFSACSLLFGCGGRPTSTVQIAPNIQVHLKPLKPIVHDPVVVFFGDSITYNWITPDVIAAHPLWINAGTPNGATGETTGQMLTRFQTDVIARHPDVVHIIAGTYDIIDTGDTWVGPCGSENPGETSTAPTAETCTNIQQMISQAEAAGIKVILGSMPPFGSGPLATQLGGAYNQVLGYYPPTPDIQQFNRNLKTLFTYGTGFACTAGSDWCEVSTLIDYNTALGAGGTTPFEYNPSDTTDGIDPNAAGGAVMTNLALKAINALKVGGAR